MLAVAGAQFCYFSAVAHMQVGPALLIEYTAPAAVVCWQWLRHGQRPGPLTLVGRRAWPRSGWCSSSTCCPGPISTRSASCGRWRRWSARATYFVISADEGNGMPPMVLAAGGLVVGTLALGLVGVIGLMPIDTATVHVTYAEHLGRCRGCRSWCSGS